MLPGAGQIGKSKVDHPDVFALDGTQDILNRGAIEKHPPTSSASTSPPKFENCRSSGFRELSVIVITHQPRRTGIRAGPASQLWSGPSACLSASARVRAAHYEQRALNVPPSGGVVFVALLFEGTSLLRRFGNGTVTVRFQQLPCVVLDIDLVHSHGVTLLFFDAAVDAAIRVAMLTPCETAKAVPG
jgi:hypothetical protein